MRLTKDLGKEDTLKFLNFVFWGRWIPLIIVLLFFAATIAASLVL